MRRRFAVSSAALVLLAMACFCALWYATRPTHHINEVSAEQIKEGMTLAEVESILGVPAGDYSTRRQIVLELSSGSMLSAPRYWTSNETSVCVDFDDNGHVVHVHSVPVVAVDESWWARLRRWTHLD